MSPRDLEWARTRVKAVTDWIAARDGSSQVGPASVEAAVGILATPPHRRNTSHSVHAATVYHVNGHLVAVYRNPGRSEVVTAECSCTDESLCEHLLVALASEDHVITLAVPPDRRDVSVTVHPATVWDIEGYKVLVWDAGPLGGPAPYAECSCGHWDGPCEHLLVALAGTEACR